MDRLEEIKARCGAATPGPWARYIEVGEKTISIYQKKRLDTALSYAGAIPEGWSGNLDKLDFTVKSSPVNSDNWHQAKFDAHFIAHARQDIPWLIEEVERLRAEATGQVEIGYATTEQMMEAAAWVDQEYGEAMKALAESEKTFIHQAGCLTCNRVMHHCECDLYARDYLSPKEAVCPRCKSGMGGTDAHYMSTQCKHGETIEIGIMQVGQLFRSGVVPF